MKRSFSINKRARIVLCAFCFAIVALVLGATGYHFARTNGEVNAEGAGTYDVIVAASPSNAGNLVGGQKDVDPGTSVIIGATAKNGYDFSRWTCSKIDSGGNVIGSYGNYNSPRATIVVGNNSVKCVAEFTTSSTGTSTLIYAVTATSDGGGTVTPTYSEVDDGEEIVLRATPDNGFRFDYWVCNGLRYERNPLTLSVHSNYTCKAFFADENYYVTVYSSDGGTATIDGESGDTKIVPSGASVTIIATSNPGYRFDKWVCSGEEYTNSRWTFTVRKPYTCTATFKEEYTPGDNTGGNTSGDNTGGDNEGGDNTGGNTSGDNTGGNTSGDNTGGDNTGDNTGGDNTGGNTSGDNTGGDNAGENTGGDTPGDNTGGDNTGGNTGDDTSGGDVPGEDGDGENKDNEKDDEKDDEKKDDKKDESSDESNNGTVAVPDTGANTNGFGGGMAGIIIALPVVAIVLLSLNFASRKVHHIKFN